MTKYSTVPLIETAVYKFRDSLISVSIRDASSKSLAIYCDFILESSNVYINSTSSRIIPLASANKSKILS